MLKDPMHEIRANAAVALGRFGSRARPAVSALLEARDDLARSGDEVPKGILEQSLWHIAPESLGKPLVVADATPIIASGVTTETFDIESNGQRRTLVPAGKRVPCVGQFWTQQPRGRLTLYRKTLGSTTSKRILANTRSSASSPRQPT